MPTIARATVLRNLQAQIGRIEGAGRNPKSAEGVSSGFGELDRLLPRGGLAGGTLVEWLGDGAGSGAMTLAMAVGGRIVRERGVMAIVGERETLFPPAVAALGVPLERAIVVQPDDRRTALWTWEQALRCEGVAVTIGRLEQTSDSVMRRLQLAVEAGGGMGFLIRPSESRAETAWAEVRLLVKGTASEAAGWRLRVELLRCRGAFGGGTTDMEIPCGGEV